MRCARSLSPELEKVIEDLSPQYLDAVVTEAIAHVRREYSGDTDILETIDAFALPMSANPEMRKRCESLAEKADARYIELEQAGRADESALQFRRMCIFNGLGWLFSDNKAARIVDEMVYDLGHGSASTDEYVKALIVRLMQYRKAAPR